MLRLLSLTPAALAGLPVFGLWPLLTSATIAGTPSLGRRSRGPAQSFNGLSWSVYVSWLDILAVIGIVGFVICQQIAGRTPKSDTRKKGEREPQVTR